jgi:DnaJ-domain-containing protein 1
MDSMYDRLGDLLSSALESGKIPEQKNSGIPVEEERNATAAKQYTVLREAQKTQAARLLNVKKGRRKGEIIHAENLAHEVHSYRMIPGSVSRAYEVLGIAPDAEEDDIRSAYRAKLKRFHPDSNSSNETIQKIARLKTAEIIDSYKMITAWLKKN